MEVAMTPTHGHSEDQTNYAPLTPEEERVIVRKGTEMPFSGKYEKFNEPGTYTCKRCGAVLYRSQDKFDSGCGWPSFDDEVPGAVRRQLDRDGIRTEILCARCGAHLGHVFTGERLTPKNTRHCVNSISMNFTPASSSQTSQTATSPSAPKTTETAIFASGCFWGSEHVLRKAKGVLSTRVGYTGGRRPSPTYQQVCTGTTGHAEAVEVTFDPSQTSYEQLARLFFETHDPTQVNRQGPDVGEQYRSVIFYTNDEQKKTAEKLIDELKLKGLPVATQVVAASTFWPAEEYHQRYYEKSGGAPYCHSYKKLF
jgi:peptide methionine sulfoxide reductase msrA/msrB